MIEVISHFVRLISLSVRLPRQHPRRPPAAAVLGGGLAVLLGLAGDQRFTFPVAFVFLVFEVGLVATLRHLSSPS